MLASRLYCPTLRDDPAEADVVSHKLMLKAGMIRKSAAGLYSFLPLGRRVVLKIENIVRHEMNAAGAQEVMMPKSGRKRAVGMYTGRKCLNFPTVMIISTVWALLMKN